MGNELSNELSRFIKQYITSLEQLEILLLLYKQPDRSWTIEEVFKVIQTNLDSVAARLTGLVSSGLAVAETPDHPTFRFHPQTDEIAQRVAELQKAYSSSKYKIIETIFAPTRDQAQKFADSFKIRRKE